MSCLGAVLGDDDYNEDNEMPELSEIEDVEIIKLYLGVILVPVRFPEQVNERRVSEPPMTNTTVL